MAFKFDVDVFLTVLALIGWLSNVLIFVWVAIFLYCVVYLIFPIILAPFLTTISNRMIKEMRKSKAKPA